MDEQLEGYVTVQQAAQSMGRSTEQVRRYLREGNLPGRHIGGQWFIREPAVLYRTGRVEGTEMPMERREEHRGVEAAGYGRMAVYTRVNMRREGIGRRWESLGISVDAGELLRELRDEER